MPLSNPAKRKLLHNRHVHCEGYLRDDGLVEIEGHMTDTKPFDFPNKDRGGFIKSGEALHGISARITLDDKLKIVDAEATLDYTPYNYCKVISPVFKKMIGISIGPGWKNHIRQAMGGVKGCTHLTELLGPMATTAFQTMVTINDVKFNEETKSLEFKQSPKFIDSCHSHAKDSPVVKEHWPDVYLKAISEQKQT